MSIYISLILHVFHCHRIDWDVFIKEANAGRGLKVQEWQKPLFKYVVPIIIAVIVNVNTHMYKKWNILMYNNGITHLLREFPEVHACL